MDYFMRLSLLSTEDAANQPQAGFGARQKDILLAPFLFALNQVPGINLPDGHL